MSNNNGNNAAATLYARDTDNIAISSQDSSPPRAARKATNTTYRNTSQAAFESFDEDTVSGQMHRVFVHIKRTDGATCWEIEQALGILHQTASARIRKLFKDGNLMDTGLRRATGSGRMAIVWGVAQ